MSNELQQQIDELQNKLAFQEHTIESLNIALTSQQAQMIKFERMLGAVTEKLKGLQPSNLADASQETPPPHY